MSGIKPMLFFGPGQCIECGGQLTIIDMETCFMRLKPDGEPEREDTIIKCEAVCLHCGKRYPMMRSGLAYVPENEYTIFMKKYMENQHRIETEQRMDSLKPTPDNPFCIMDGQS